MNNTTDIDKKSTWTEAAKEVEYLAAKRDDGADYERLMLTEPAADDLDRWWDEACTEAAHAFLSCRDAALDAAGDKLSVTAANGLIGQIVRACLVKRLAGRWLGLCGHPAASEYAADASAMYTMAARLGVGRRARRKPQPF